VVCNFQSFLTCWIWRIYSRFFKLWLLAVKECKESSWMSFVYSYQFIIFWVHMYQWAYFGFFFK
jgi:hypothetical protein